MGNEGVLRAGLANLLFVFWIDRRRDRRKTVSEIGADAEHGHRFERQIRVVLRCWTGECWWSRVQRILSRNVIAA